MKESNKKRYAARHGQNEGEGEGSAFSAAFFAGLFALPVSVGIGLVLLLALSLAAYTAKDPDKLTAPLGICALVITSVLCGFISARRGGHAAALCGLVGGALLTLFLLAASLCFSDSARAAMTLGASGGVSLLLHAGVVILSVAGSMLGFAMDNKESKKPRHGKNYFDK